MISTEIADIFRSNSLKNGLLPIVVGDAFHAELMAAPCNVRVDLEARTVTLLDGPSAGASSTFDIDGFSRYCLMRGIDQLGFLLDRAEAIAAFEAGHDATSPP